MVFTKEDTLSQLTGSSPLIQNLISKEIQIQPNGIDLSVAEILNFEGQGRMDFSGEERNLPKLSAIPFNDNGWVELKKGSYLITFNEVVNIPTDAMAIGRPRSSMLKMGATVETAVWDAGYKGVSKSLLIVENQHGIQIKKNARVMQLVFIKLTAQTEAYTGKY